MARFLFLTSYCKRLATSNRVVGISLITFTLISFTAGWNLLTLLLLIVTTAHVTAWMVILQTQDRETQPPTDSQGDGGSKEFFFRFPDPCEYGWLTYSLTPDAFTYTEEVCYGGPPTDTSKYEYHVEGEHVFARLVTLYEVGLYESTYDVVVGQILEPGIRTRRADEVVDQHIDHLKAKVLWNEILGSLRYLILSKHGCKEDFFKRELSRLNKGFAAVEKKAKTLGATREERHYFKAGEKTDEQTIIAIKELQSGSSLARLGISFRELYDYERTIETLQSLLMP